MKQFFRFFRGELNGFFINNICTFLNRYLAGASQFLDEMAYQSHMQWIVPGRESNYAVSLRDEDVYNIGIIGGLFQPRNTEVNPIGSRWYTASDMPGSISSRGKLRTERGLVNTTYESFDFVHVENDNYATDINQLANEGRRSTFRERGAQLLGYVAEGNSPFNEDGTLDQSVILDQPPVGAAYIEWYGFKYLHYEDQFTQDLPLTIDVYMLLFEAVQRIRRRGPNIASLLEITELLGGGYIKNLGGKDISPWTWLDVDSGLTTPDMIGLPKEPYIEQQDWWYNCYYDLDPGITLYNRERRYNAWLSVMKMKFKTINFIDRDTLGG